MEWNNRENLKFFQALNLVFLFTTISDQEAVIDDVTAVYSESIGKRAYIGVFCKIESNSTIGEMAVIQRGVTIESGAIVKPSEIYAVAPTSFSLYKRCVTYVLAHKYVFSFQKPTAWLR